MKKTFLFIAFFAYFGVIAQTESITDFFEKSNVFFGEYVSQGKVAYQEIAENPEKLNELYQLMDEVEIDVNSPKEYQAFWINAYNISVIKGIVDNYPLQSPQEVSGFFDRKKYQIAGEKVTLNNIENKKLRAEFDEPRFHFVLVCGAVSCPPIVNFAYTPDELEKQLEQQTRKAINDPEFLRVNPEKEEVQFSRIFDWYGEDFTRDGMTKLKFVNQYLDEKIPADYKQTFYEYDWTLNGISNLENTSSSNANQQNGSVIQNLTPSKLLQKGQWDLKVFNNFYSETKAKFNGTESDKARENFFTSSFAAFYGISKNARFNIGALVNLNSTTRSNDTVSKGFFSPIGFQNEAGISRAGLGSAGPSIRFVPFNKISNFSVQTSVLFPLLKEESKNGVFLARNSYQWETRLFFDKSLLNKQFQIFAETDLIYFFGEAGEGFANNSLGVPVSLFFSYFPVDWFTIYINGQRYFLIDLGNEFSQEFNQIGSGMKFQLNPVLNLEVSYTNFVSGRDTGLGETINLGLRAVF